MNLENILQEWEDFARSIYPARHMNQRDLRDHARNMLLAIADDLDQPQTKEAQKQKSRGRQKTNLTAAAGHGFHRHSGGFSISETISEFRALRASVIAQWERQSGFVTPEPVDDLIRFNEAIDQAVNDSALSYAVEKERHTRLFDTILAASPDAIFVLDTERRILYANPAMERLAGLREQEMVGLDACDSTLPFGYDMKQQIAWIVDHRQARHGEASQYGPKGDTQFEWCLIPVESNDHEEENTVGILHDITERKLAEEEIWHIANYDLLTELPNRRLFFDRLEQGVEHCSRIGVPLAVMFIDLDGFKEINDRLGHEAGDQVLRGVADRLDRCIRKADTAARLGGDEFAV
ncbi:MAG: diguanylate cyclase domain-containing protein, partial [Wenzhouxiangella sp.]